MRVRVAIAVLLTAAMATFGVGCTGQPPATGADAQQQAQNIGNFLFFLIYRALCDSNGGVCPFPIAPSDPPFYG